mgnify:CR=1 FL=1
MLLPLCSSVRLPMQDGRPRGFAFIAFESTDAANKALEKDGEEMMGRWLKINLSTGAKPKTDKTPMKRDLSEKPEDCDTVFVGNLAWTATEEEIREAFSACGEVAAVRLAWDHDNDRPKG